MKHRSSSMRRQLVACLIGVPVLMAWALPGMTQQPRTKATKKAELRIGCVTSLSGPFLSWGMAVLGGAELAAEDVNAKGGLVIGDTAYTIKVVAYDEKTTGEDAVKAAQRLISQDNIKFIIGPLGTGSVIAVTPVTESAKAITLTNGYGARLSADKRHFFRVTPTTIEFAGPLAAWVAKNNPKLKTVAIMLSNDQTGQQMVVHNQRAWERAGLTMVAKDAFEHGTQDFVPMLTKLMAAKPDVIDLDGTAPTVSGIIIKQARQLGYQGQFVKVGGPGTPEIIKVAGEAADGLIYYSPWNLNDSATRTLLTRFEAKYKMLFNPLGIFFYEGSAMLFDAMAKTQSLEVETVRTHIENSKGYDGMLGRFVWGGEANYGIRHQWIAPFFVAQVQKGKEVILQKLEAQ